MELRYLSFDLLTRVVEHIPSGIWPFRFICGSLFSLLSCLWLCVTEWDLLELLMFSQKEQSQKWGRR